MTTQTKTTTKAVEVQPKQRNLEAKRKPFGTKNSRLNVENLDTSFEYRWFNDEPGRLAAANDAGYQYVTPDEVNREANDDSRVKEYAGVQRNGEPLFAYLMKIDKVFFMEDQQAKQKHLDKIDDAIKGGKLNQQAGDNRYVPEGGISIK